MTSRQPSAVLGGDLADEWPLIMADKIHLAIITYNRAGKLEAVLAQLASSPFYNCVIYVLDNCSADRTQEVCEAAAGKLPRLHCVRHRLNIGACANYLRAVELCTAQYSWIICDDDFFDFDKAADIYERIRKGEDDLISVGVETHGMAPGWSGSARECAMTQDYFLSHSFIPSLIFKTELFDSRNIIKAYDSVETQFPHVGFVCDMASTGRLIYVSKEKVIRKSNSIGYPPLSFMGGWINCCGRLSDRRLRSRAFSAVFGGRRFVENLCFGVMVAKSCNQRRLISQYGTILLDAARRSPVVFLKLLLMFPAVLLLLVAHPLAWKAFLKYRQRHRQMAAPEYDGDR